MRGLESKQVAVSFSEPEDDDNSKDEEDDGKSKDEGHVIDRHRCVL
jgi:hypothetical protein